MRIFPFVFIFLATVVISGKKENALRRRRRTPQLIYAGAKSVLEVVGTIIGIVVGIQENAEPFDDCPDDTIKDELELIEITMRGFHERIQAYQTNSQEFHCKPFVRTVNKMKKMIVHETKGLEHYCDYRWYWKKQGLFRSNTFERMGADGNSVCTYLSKPGSECQRWFKQYCKVERPCQPSCKNCRQKLEYADRLISYASTQLLTCHIPLENVVQKALPTRTLSLSLSPRTREESSPTPPATTSTTIFSPKDSWTRTLGTVTVFADSSDSMTKSDDKIRQVNDVIGQWSGISLGQGIGEVLVTKFSSRLHLFSRAKVQSNGKLSFHDFTLSSLQRTGSWDAPAVEIEKSSLKDATTDCLNSNLHPNDQKLGWNQQEYDFFTRKSLSNEEGKSYFFHCLWDLYHYYEHADFDRYARGTIVVLTDGEKFDDFPTTWYDQDSKLWERRMRRFNNHRRSRRSLSPMKEEPVCELFGKLSRYVKKIIWILVVEKDQFVQKTKSEFMIKRLMNFHISRDCRNYDTIDIEFQINDFNDFS